MATKPKPTKAQLDYARARARASGIDMNQSAKGLRNASKAIIAAASLAPAGRVVKAAQKGAQAVKFTAQRANFSRGTIKKEVMLKKRAASNSAAAAKIVGPKSSVAKRKELISAQEKLSAKEIVRTNPKFQRKMKSVLPEKVLRGRSVKVVPSRKRVV